MWPGGEVTKDVRPTYHIRYKSGVTALSKLESVLGWLDKPREERPTVITAYINEVDSTGHDFGPEGKRSKFPRQKGEIIDPSPPFSMKVCRRDHSAFNTHEPVSTCSPESNR